MLRALAWSCYRSRQRHRRGLGLALSARNHRRSPALGYAICTWLECLAASTSRLCHGGRDCGQSSVLLALPSHAGFKLYVADLLQSFQGRTIPVRSHSSTFLCAPLYSVSIIFFPHPPFPFSFPPFPPAHSLCHLRAWKAQLAQLPILLPPLANASCF